MKRLVKFVSVIGVVVMLIGFLNPITFNIVSAQSPQKTEIDLDRDDDGDGLPDAMVEEMNQIQVIADSAIVGMEEGSVEMAAEVIDTAIADFVSRLPYEEETRKLQEELALLDTKLSNASTESDALQTIDEMNTILEQMKKDPNYVTATNALLKMAAPAGATVNPPSRVFLPTVFKGNPQQMQTLQADVSETGTLRVEEAILDKNDRTTYAPSSVSLQAPKYTGLHKGDIMLVRTGQKNWNSFVYAMWYTHAGVYTGSSVYSSNTKGVVYEPLQDWKKRGNYVALGYNKRTSYWQDIAALNWAIGKYKTNGSTGYNFKFADKVSDKASGCLFKPMCLYCSQLVWKIQKYNNVDVDSNHEKYLTWIAAKKGSWASKIARSAVAPDEIALDSDVIIYSQGWN